MSCTLKQSTNPKSGVKSHTSTYAGEEVETGDKTAPTHEAGPPTKRTGHSKNERKNGLGYNTEYGVFVLTPFAKYYERKK